jgi:hypothetical protein
MKKLIVAISMFLVLIVSAAHAQNLNLIRPPNSSIYFDVQDQLDNVPFGPIAIVLPDANYWYVEPIHVSRQVTITGNGAILHFTTAGFDVRPGGNLSLSGVIMVGPEALSSRGRLSNDILHESCGVVARFSGAHAEIKNVTIRGFYAGMAAVSGASVLCDGSRILENSMYGIAAVLGGHADAINHWLIADNGGDGLHASSGGSAWVTDGGLRGNLGSGVYSGNGGEITAARVNSVGNRAYGWGADSGAVIRAVGCSASGNLVDWRGEVLR